MPYADPAAGIERQRRRRIARRIARRLDHPRCVICSGAMEYGKPGLNFRAVTCGRRCAVTRSNWMKAA